MYTGDNLRVKGYREGQKSNSPPDQLFTALFYWTDGSPIAYAVSMVAQLTPSALATTTLTPEIVPTPTPTPELTLTAS